MAQFKWFSDRGTLLGVVTLPDSVASALRRIGHVRFRVGGCLAKSPFCAAPEADVSRLLSDTYDVVSIRWSLADSTRGRSGQCVEITGTTPERLEAVPGFAFAPGAAYLRSIVDGG